MKAPPPEPTIPTPEKPVPGPESIDDWDALRGRISDTARRAHDHEIAYRAEIERRNELLVRAFDHNLAPVNEIAAAARLSPSSLYRIVTGDG